MKIFVVISQPPNHVRIGKYLDTFKRLKHEVTFIGWDRLGRHKDQTAFKEIRGRFLLHGWNENNTRKIMGIFIWMLRLSFYLLKSPFKQNVIFVMDFDSAFPVAVASLFNKTRFIYDIPDNYYMRAKSPWLKSILKLLDSWVMRKANQIIVVDVNRITEVEKPFKDKIHVVYNCPPDVPPPLSASPQRPFTVYASGYLASWRGIPLLLEAARRIPEMRILMAGQFPEHSLESQVKVNPQVDFRGQLAQEDALKLCYESDVVFSFYEPSSEINRRAASNKLYDAMMTGCPVLTNREIINSAFVEKFGIGYICDYNVDALVRMLREIQSRSDEGRRRGERGRLLFEEEYNWDKMESRIKFVLHRVYANR
jgi:glycosyltransferase involved in cell wall biosynthesis